MKHILTKDLTDFLRKEKIYIIFLENCIELREHDDNVADISSAFDWGSTSEGYQYWDNISDKFQMYNIKKEGCNRIVPLVVNNDIF